jgi:hypothetical protein
MASRHQFFHLDPVANMPFHKHQAFIVIICSY